jgi:hypothetical protein
MTPISKLPQPHASRQRARKILANPDRARRGSRRAGSPCRSLPLFRNTSPASTSSTTSFPIRRPWRRVRPRGAAASRRTAWPKASLFAQGKGMCSPCCRRHAGSAGRTSRPNSARTSPWPAKTNSSNCLRIALPERSRQSQNTTGSTPLSSGASADQPDVYFEGGDHTTLVHVSQSQFAQLTGHAPRALRRRWLMDTGPGGRAARARRNGIVRRVEARC